MFTHSKSSGYKYEFEFEMMFSDRNENISVATIWHVHKKNENILKIAAAFVDIIHDNI